MGRAVIEWSLDTFVSSFSPSESNETSQVVWVSQGSRVGFVHMNSPVPLGATVISATLRLTSWSTPGSATVEVRRSLKRPAYGWLTWNNDPGTYTASTPVTQTQPAGATVWEFDVTGHLQGVADGMDWYGWRIVATNTGGDVRFRSQESGMGAVLDVEWSDRPDAPTALNPSGGRMVASTKPVLSFDVVDVAGDTTLSAVQVQISRSAAMDLAPAVPSVPEEPDVPWDSGTVLTSTPRLDLADTSYPGAVQGTPQFWRARARDGAELWSDWSEVAEFGYVGKGTFTVSSPSEAGLTISDNTPVIAWNLDGRTQAAYQVAVALTSDPGKWLWQSGKVTSTATSLTIPAGVIRRDDRNYRIIVHVWDTIDRVSTPGDPARYRITRDVHFDDDAAVAPVDSLFAEPVGESPEVVLTATRSTMPDKWMILRGTEIIASAAGADLHVGGTEYRFVDRTAPGMAESRYRFQPVENGKRAWGNPEAFATPDPRYVWVTSLDGSLKVPILNAEVSWEPQSQTELLTPLGSRRPVMVRHSLGARVGSVAGMFITDTNGMLGVEAGEHKAALAQIEALGEPVRLMSGDENVPVVIYDLNLSPRSYRDRGAVTFAMFQDGEFPDDGTV